MCDQLQKLNKIYIFQNSFIFLYVCDSYICRSVKTIQKERLHLCKGSHIVHRVNNLKYESIKEKYSKHKQGVQHFYFLHTI